MDLRFRIQTSTQGLQVSERIVQQSITIQDSNPFDITTQINTQFRRMQTTQEQEQATITLTLQPSTQNILADALQGYGLRFQLVVTGTATEGTDYTIITNDFTNVERKTILLSDNDNNQPKTFQINILDDDQLEGLTAETIEFALQPVATQEGRITGIPQGLIVEVNGNAITVAQTPQIFFTLNITDDEAESNIMVSTVYLGSTLTNTPDMEIPIVEGGFVQVTVSIGDSFSLASFFESISQDTGSEVDSFYIAITTDTTTQTATSDRLSADQSCNPQTSTTGNPDFGFLLNPPITLDDGTFVLLFTEQIRERIFYLCVYDDENAEGDRDTLTLNLELRTPFNERGLTFADDSDTWSQVWSIDDNEDDQIQVTITTNIVGEAVDSLNRDFLESAGTLHFTLGLNIGFAPNIRAQACLIIIDGLRPLDDQVVSAVRDTTNAFDDDESFIGDYKTQVIQTASPTRIITPENIDECSGANVNNLIQGLTTVRYPLEFSTDTDSYTLQIKINNDSLLEEDEQFTMELSRLRFFQVTPTDTLELFTVPEDDMTSMTEELTILNDDSVEITMTVKGFVISRSPSDAQPLDIVGDSLFVCEESVSLPDGQRIVAQENCIERSLEPQEIQLMVFVRLSSAVAVTSSRDISLTLQANSETATLITQNSDGEEIGDFSTFENINTTAVPLVFAQGETVPTLNNIPVISDSDTPDDLDDDTSSLRIRIRQDFFLEGNESFTLTLELSDPNAPLPDNVNLVQETVVITILDNEAVPEWSITVPEVGAGEEAPEIQEGDGILYEVSYSQATLRTSDVTISIDVTLKLEQGVQLNDFVLPPVPAESDLSPFGEFLHNVAEDVPGVEIRRTTDPLIVRILFSMPSLVSSSTRSLQGDSTPTATQTVIITAPQRLRFHLIPQTDQRLERTERFSLTLSNPMINEEPGGEISQDHATVTVNILQNDENITPTQELVKLVTPLILRHSVPVLADTVHQQVTRVLSNYMPPAPFLSSDQYQINFHALTDGYIPEPDKPRDRIIDHLPTWNVWSTGQFANISGGYGTEVRGNVINVWSGVDYRISKYTILGILGGYEFSDMKVDAITGQMRGTGYGGGVYGGTSFSRGSVIVDMSAVWLNLNYDTTALDEKTSFTGQRIMLTANITGIFKRGPLRITPNINIMWGQENHQQDSKRLLARDYTYTFGRVSAGPQIAFRFPIGQTSWIEPFVQFKADYDFDVTLPAATVDGSEDLVYAYDPDSSFGGQIKGGFSSAFNHNLSLNIEAMYADILRPKYTSLSGSVSLGYTWSQTSFSLTSFYKPGGLSFSTLVRWPF